MSSGQRTFDYHIIQFAPEGCRAFKEEVQRSRRGDNQSEKRVIEPRILLHQFHAGKMQTGRHCDAVDSGI